MRAKRIYKALLLCYPAAFRHEYGRQMLLMFSEQLGEARRSGFPFREATLWLRAAFDALITAPREHTHVIVQDLRYALRSIAASPAFAMVAIVSLALGIGGATAVFSVWHGLSRSSLAGVQRPRELMMLTDPDVIGSWNGTLNGLRPWLSFEEFEQLRTRADKFSSLMAVQSYLDTWRIESRDGGWEDARGRFVSDGYFNVLGVRPALGRVFADTGELAAPEVVISDSYWRRRFGGSRDALGKTLGLRNVELTVIGVAPATFAGETVGQQPDLWAPLRMQPFVKPGEDWLHDKYPDKYMWLQVFGRLKPGANLFDAEEQANTIFKAGLAAFYEASSNNGPTSPGRREPLNQSLLVHLGARGVSGAAGELSNSLTALFTAVGVLLLITCLNLANLLLARGAARRTEIALRMSLGASRGRMIRQLLTESLLLALAGGITSLAAFYLLYGALIRLVARSSRDFRMSFALDPLAIGFTAAVTLVAAVLFGLLPAWQAARPGAGDIVREQRRCATASLGRIRWGKLLVSAQLALSLPLLVAGGLLARSLYNLQHINLGYSSSGLLVARLNTDMGGYDAARRNVLYRDLRERLRQTPGIAAASFSGLGLFAGANMSFPIEVEGYGPNRAGDRESAMELAGPSYFSTIGIPVLRGREILEGDDAGAVKVCVINQAFAKQYFDGRDAIGLQVTAVSRTKRIAYRVIGIAKDARTQNLRAPVRPRFYVPWTQSPLDPKAPILLVRASGGTGVAAADIRQAIQQADPTLPIDYVRALDEQIAPLTAQDRSTAQVTEVFGGAALLLAAIGLYGVLAYGVARQRSEIAIRVALGAQGRRVIGMVLRDTAWLLAAGLAAGAILSYAATRLIRGQLYGIAPEDPATLTLSIALLVGVAMSAAYLPARRAVRLDAMAILREE